MNLLEMNSKEYWENRFVTGSWDTCGGEEQSSFFAELIFQALPLWLKEEMQREHLSVIDWGCAEGGGTAYLAKRFPVCSFTGIDFSEDAVQKARTAHSNCSFEIGDIMSAEKAADVIISSNTLEHLRQPYEVLGRLVRCARKYAILLLPLRDNSEIAEHINYFEESFFPMELEDHVLAYFEEIDCEMMNSPYWPGEQLMVVYAGKNMPCLSDRRLSDHFSNRAYLKSKEVILKRLSEQETTVSALTDAKAMLTQENAQLSDAKAMLTQENARLSDAKATLTQENARLSDAKAMLTQENARLSDAKATLTQENARLTDANAGLKQKNAQLSGKNTELCEKAASAQQTIQKLQKENGAALNQLTRMCDSRIFKLVHFLYRFFKQGLSRNAEERKAFRRWIRGKRRGEFTAEARNHRYNPLFAVINILQGNEVLSNEDAAASAEEESLFDRAKLAAVLRDPYQKPDIIELAIIDYDFRHQRPQHLAQRLAKKGHRVFYVDANFAAQPQCIMREENVFQLKLKNEGQMAIYETDLSDCLGQTEKELDAIIAQHGIRDAVVLVDYPNWVNAADYLRKKYGFRIITDYMDDYTGFLNSSEDRVRNSCFRLLKNSDAVVASSAFLKEIAQKHSDHVYVSRNGTEYDHFHKAYQRDHEVHARPVIGYFGAIAEWFHAKSVCRCAERFPECDIVLVGSVTAHRKELEKYRNIRLIGEVPYKELLPWLESFDVCLIPFDASTDLIKATNPVKFYEYLSAGKKVVATEIPELMPYRGKFALLENDPDKFCDAVQRCLDGTDGLASIEEMLAFARSNDWDARAEDMSAVIDAIYPKISIIVLCYNQLDYTKQCVESILHNTAYPNYELVIVDNNSSDDTAAYLKELDKRYDQVKIVLNTANRGFAGGNNDGIAASDGEYIVLLNNDTVVTRGWLTGLVKHYAGDDKVALVGPVTNSIGNEGKIKVDYASIDDMPDFAFRYTQKHMGEEYPHHGVLAMYCLMISRAFYEQAGPLDENYGVGMFEDDDYSFAAASLGFRTAMAEDVFIHHYGTVSFKKLENETYRALFEKNKAYFEKKWNTTWKMHIARPGAFE